MWLIQGKWCKAPFHTTRLPTETMLMLYSSTVVIQCLLLVAMVLPSTVAEEDASCEMNDQVCHVDDLAFEERGSSLLQVDLRLRSDRDVESLPMGPLAVLTETGHVARQVAQGPGLEPEVEPAAIQHPAIAQRSLVQRPQESEVAFDSISLVQSNETVISRRDPPPVYLNSLREILVARMLGHQTNDTKTSRRLHLLDLGRTTDSSTIIWVLLAGIVVAFLILLLILAVEDRAPPAERAVVRHATGKYERLSPQAPQRSSQSAMSSPIREDIPGSAMTMGTNSPSLPPTATVPQSFPENNAQPEQAVIAPPPICPSLILPHTEARFMVPMEQMKVHGPGALDINGTSGRKLLHATVSDTGDGRRCLSVASCGCEDDPRVTVFTPERQSFARTPLTGSMGGQPMSHLEVYGKAGQFYGTLSPAPGGGMLLKHESGSVVLAVQANGDEDLRMTASSYIGGQLLASAGRNIGARRSKAEVGDSWKLQVKPGVDAVLIVSCMLGTFLLAMPPSSSSRSPKMLGMVGL